MRPAQPLSNRLIGARTCALDRVAKLADDLGRRGAIEPLSPEDEVRHVGPEAELVAELDIVFRAEVGDVVLAVVDDLGADVGELPRRKTLAEGEDAAADAISSLEHNHVMAGSLDLGRGDKPRQTGTDNRHLHMIRPPSSSTTIPDASGHELMSRPARAMSSGCAIRLSGISRSIT